jgi:hypothetical protein
VTCDLCFVTQICQRKDMRTPDLSGETNGPREGRRSRRSGEFSGRGDDVVKFPVRYRSAKFAAFSNGENRVGTLVCESGGPSPTQLRTSKPACGRQAAAHQSARALSREALVPVRRRAGSGNSTKAAGLAHRSGATSGDEGLERHVGAKPKNGGVKPPLQEKKE